MPRTRAFAAALLAGGLLLWGRLAQLQGWESLTWRERGEQLRLWDEEIPARRGRLLDRNGVPLADNQPWVGEQPLDPRLQALLAEQQDLRGGSDPQFSAERVYPQGPLCAHVCGYVSEGAGRDGLELALDERLRGRPGRRRWLVTAQGKRLRLLHSVAPIAGEDVSLTLDVPLQTRARDSLLSVIGQLTQPGNIPAGAVVVLEAKSGRVLALVSCPEYEANDFVDPRRGNAAQAWLRRADSPLLNRAIAGLYPAASTFKIVTGSAALQDGLIPPERRFVCPGVRYIGGVPFHCFVRTGHGTLSFESSVAHSCDCVYYDLGRELGGRRIKEWARRWGLGNPSGLQLPGEESGSLPEPSQYADWAPGDDANLSIGQGYLLVTPLQMARVAAGVVNRGYLPRPTLLPGESAGSSVELAPAAWDRLQEGLRGTVEVGTAAGAFRPGLRVAGKTGTVENSPSTSNPRGFNHTWFVGYGPLESRTRSRSPCSWSVREVTAGRSPHRSRLQCSKSGSGADSSDTLRSPRNLFQCSEFFSSVFDCLFGRKAYIKKHNLLASRCWDRFPARR